jgi:hypothetical protein
VLLESSSASQLMTPPLNQSLWALLIASLTAVAAWIVVHLSARIEREPQEPALNAAFKIDSGSAFTC